MDVTQALEHLNEIRHHLGRNEIYRGYRSKTLTLMGGVGFAGGLFLQLGWTSAKPIERVGFWVAMAALNMAIAAWEILGDYGELKTDHQRRTTRRTVGQFLPTMATGVLLTTVFVSQGHNLNLLPGLWAVLFSLGIFASRPYLPRGVGWVGAFFLASGALLLCFPQNALSQPLNMGGIFGVGHLMLAYVMYQNLERETL
jgi:hypothetical protein